MFLFDTDLIPLKSYSKFFNLNFDIGLTISNDWFKYNKFPINAGFLICNNNNQDRINNFKEFYLSSYQKALDLEKQILKLKLISHDARDFKKWWGDQYLFFIMFNFKFPNGIKKYFDVGVDKVILGGAAIKDKKFLKEACEKFPNKIAIGLDAKDGYLSVSGWKENSNLLTLDYLKEVNDYGVSRLIYTDIDRDGMKQSPNFDETSKVSEISNCPVIISGGVSSLEDIRKAKDLKNIEGIIVGKALYDGDIKLEELVKEDA